MAKIIGQDAFTGEEVTADVSLPVGFPFGCIATPVSREPTEFEKVKAEYEKRGCKIRKLNG